MNWGAELARFCTLFSGSSGNSYYIGSGDAAILIDAGRSAKQIEHAIQSNELDIKAVRAIFVTHEHSDHIKGIRVLASRYGLKVYSSKGTLEALENMEVLNGKFPYDVIDERGIEIAGMFVVPFATSHDSRESVGYIIKTADDRKLVIATDIGIVSDTVRSAVKGSDLAVIESNHDVHMLQNGSYPYYLKRRILSKTGHLSNEACAEELPKFAKTGATRFVLAHLSGENNLPLLAYETALSSLQACGMKKGIDFQLFVAPKENIGGKSMIF